MRALLLASFAFVGAVSHARPAVRYIPMQPFELVLQADLIVDGAVVAFDEKSPREEWPRPEQPPTIALEVRETIAGKCTEKRLVVQAFLNWTCHQRYRPYELGQRAIYFLQHVRTKKGEVLAEAPMSIMGAGNEGECPLIDHEVFYRAARAQYAAPDPAFPCNSEYKTTKTSHADFVASVRGLRRCFEWKGEPGEHYFEYPRSRLRQTCSAEELAAYQASSPLAHAIVRDSRALKLVRKEAEKAG